MGMNPRLLRPLASGLTNPNAIAGLNFWLDAQTPSSYTESSGQISEWRSRVGSLAVAQSTANNRPTLFESSSNVQNATRAVINSRQALFFDGVNDSLATASNFGVTQRTLFAVVSFRSVSAVRIILSNQSGSSPPASQFLRTNGTAVESNGHTSAAVNYLASASSVATNTSYILRAVQTASGLQVFINNAGGTVTSGAQGTAQGILRVGSFDGSGFLFSGLLGEIVFYDRDLTASEQTAVYNYLSARWGL
jgi:hypothetical protein